MDPSVISYWWKKVIHIRDSCIIDLSGSQGQMSWLNASLRDKPVLQSGPTCEVSCTSTRYRTMFNKLACSDQAVHSKRFVWMDPWFGRSLFPWLSCHVDLIEILVPRLTQGSLLTRMFLKHQSWSPTSGREKTRIPMYWLVMTIWSW